LWRARFLSVVAGTVWYEGSCETAAFIPYSAKREVPETGRAVIIIKISKSCISFVTFKHWLSILKAVIGNLIQLLDLLSRNRVFKKDSVPWSYFVYFKRTNVAGAFHPYVILSNVTITSGAAGAAFSLGTYLV
jgi:hypothetical protein